MSSKDDFYKKLEENDIFISLTHYQRLTIAEMHEKQLTITNINQQIKEAEQKGYDKGYDKGYKDGLLNSPYKKIKRYVSRK